MVWTFPPAKDKASTEKIFYNGKPVIVPSDYAEHKEDILNIGDLSLRRIIENVGITLNNIIYDSLQGDVSDLLKSDRQLYIGIFVAAIGIIGLVIGTLLSPKSQKSTIVALPKSHK